jgi:NAD(P)-dependent dehydrogenase (short-subunit alcohol dehydrogenase family)
VADIAATVKFLCSEEAAFISGCDLRVDGGLIAAMSTGMVTLRSSEAITGGT